MDDVEFVDVLDAGDDLLEEATGFFFLDASVSDNVVVELTSTRIFRDQIELLRRLYDLVKLHDVRVPDDLQDVDLSGHSLHVRHVRDPVLLQDLHGHLLSRQNVRAQSHLPERSLPDRLPCPSLPSRTEQVVAN